MKYGQRRFLSLVVLVDREIKDVLAASRPWKRKHMLARSTQHKKVHTSMGWVYRKCICYINEVTQKRKEGNFILEIKSFYENNFL